LNDNATKQEGRELAMTKALFPLLCVTMAVSAVAADPGDIAMLKAIGRPTEAEAVIGEAEVELGPSSCIGPFKDAEFGTLRQSFSTRFEVEIDTLEKNAPLMGGGIVPD
jgi:hypothetical protein